MNFRIADVTDVPALAAMRWSFRSEEGEVPIETHDDFAKRFGDFVSEGLRTGNWTYWIAETAEHEIVSQMAVVSFPPSHDHRVQPISGLPHRLLHASPISK